MLFYYNGRHNFERGTKNEKPTTMAGSGLFYITPNGATPDCLKAWRPTRRVRR